MLRATWRGLLAHKLRLALSAVAVVLGVAFVAGSYVFTDTLEQSFTQLYEETGSDVAVTPASSLASDVTSGATSSLRVPASVLETVRAVDGVARATGDVQVPGVRLVDAAGAVVGTAGAPGIGVGWTGDPGASLTVTDGRAPERAGEVAVDGAAVTAGGFALGETITLVMPRGTPIEVTLVGTLRFGATGNLAGATLTAFDQTTAEALLTAPGEYTTLAVTSAEGTTPAEVAQRVAAAVGPGYDVRTGEQTAADGARAIEQALGFLSTLLLAFAGVALFVGSFIILNTFTMIVAQRTRELALLRAIGASRGQVTRSVLTEALVVGAVGSVLGLAAGVGIAKLLQVVFAAVGLEIATGGLVLAPRTVVVSLLVGLVVTLVAAYLPARRAGRVPPAAALQADVALPAGSLHRRAVLGAGLGAAGAVGLVLAVTVADDTRAAQLLAVGVAGTLLGVVVASPAIAVRLVPLIGAPVRRFRGAVGRLSVENAVRNPRRTSATASALMVGLALVSAFSVLAASLTASVDELVDSALGGADVIVSDATRLPFSPAVATAVAEVDGVATVIRQRNAVVQVGGNDPDPYFVATDPVGLTDLLTYDFTSGSADGLETGLVLDADQARAGGWSVGDAVPVTVGSGTRTLVLGGIYTVDVGLGSGAISLSTLEAAGGELGDTLFYVGFADGVDTAAVTAAVDAAVAPYPQLEASDRAEFKDAQRDQVNQILFLVYALLALAVLIAVLGIVNTLALSVVERTREIGLLRAVGTSRRQLRAMVRWESFVIALYGAVLGLVLGVLYGSVLQQVLAAQGISVLAVPWTSLAVLLVLAGLVGVLAALWPARRAARMDVLAALTRA